jgi:hypothetical protein
MGHVNVARANHSSCAASCKDEAAKARPCSFFKIILYDRGCVYNFLPDVFSVTQPKVRLYNSKVAVKNTMFGQGIFGKILPEFFQCLVKKSGLRHKGSPVFCHEDVNNVKIILL